MAHVFVVIVLVLSPRDRLEGLDECLGTSMYLGQRARLGTGLCGFP